jgi:hypothetical protein
MARNINPIPAIEIHIFNIPGDNIIPPLPERYYIIDHLEKRKQLLIAGWTRGLRTQQQGERDKLLIKKTEVKRGEFFTPAVRLNYPYSSFILSVCFVALYAIYVKSVSK